MRQLIESLTCDRCERVYSDYDRRYTDAAGSSETRAIYFDLCGDCQYSVLSKLLSEHDWQADVVAFVRNYVPHAQVKD